MLNIFRFRHSERGLALIYALLLLALGAVITVPLLSFMNTGLVAAQVYEENTMKIYAADAGIQDALWKINNCRLVGDEGEEFLFNYKDTDGVLYEDVLGHLPPSDPDILDVVYPIYYYIEGASGAVNGYDVMVSIEYRSQNIFEVISTQYDPETIITPEFVNNNPSEFTSIKAWVSTVYGDYSGITQNAITSISQIDITGQGSTDPLEGEPNGPLEFYSGAWPTTELLEHFYSQDIVGLDSYNSDEIDVNDYPTIGPFYRDGNLTIESSEEGATIKLTDTIYITGYTLIGQTSKFFLDLNGNTIFVLYDGDGSDFALQIGSNCTILGSGCIIAIGGIKMMPNIDTDNYGFILTLSVSGLALLKPRGDYHGTLAGGFNEPLPSGKDPISVDLQNGNLYWDTPPTNLHFPTGDDSNNKFGILSYIIS